MEPRGQSPRCPSNLPPSDSLRESIRRGLSVFMAKSRGILPCGIVARLLGLSPPTQNIILHGTNSAQNSTFVRGGNPSDSSGRRRIKAQATLEFAFCLIVVFLIFYSCIKAMQWVGIALVRPSIEHKMITKNPPNDDVEAEFLSAPLKQSKDELPELDLVFQGNILNNP